MPTGDGRLGMLRAGTYGRGLWQIPLLADVKPFGKYGDFWASCKT